MVEHEHIIMELHRDEKENENYVYLIRGQNGHRTTGGMNYLKSIPNVLSGLKEICGYEEEVKMLDFFDFKSFNGGEDEDKDKEICIRYRWTDELEHQLLTILQKHLPPTVPVETLPAVVKTILKRKYTCTIGEQEMCCRINEELYHLLYGYQREALYFGVSRNGRMFLGDEMGLGKTLTIVALLNYYLKAGRQLIICPASLTFVWYRYMLKYSLLPGLIQYRQKKLVSIEEIKEEIVENKEESLPPLKRRKIVVETKEQQEKRKIKELKLKDREEEDWLNPYIQIVKNGKEDIKGHIVIISYALATAVADKKLSGSRFSTVVMDESHYLKNGKSQRCKALTKLGINSKHCFLMSGSPMSCPQDLFSQLKAIDKTLFPGDFFPFISKNNTSKEKDAFDPKNFYFATRYCQPKKIRYGQKDFVYVHKGSERIYELNALLKHSVLLRRMKQDVLKDLPPKLRECITVGKAPLDCSFGIDKKKFKQKNNYEDEKMEDFSQDIGFLEKWRKTMEIKIPFVIAYLKEVILPGLQQDPHLKVILFFHHSLMGKAIKELVEQHTRTMVANTTDDGNEDMEEEKNKNMKNIFIDGSIARDKRQLLVDQFQQDTSTRIAMLSITACAEGITLTKSSLTVVTELMFCPSTHIQAECRSHRISQLCPVTIQYLILSGSTDDNIWPILNRKLDVSSKTLDNCPALLDATTSSFSCTTSMNTSSPIV